MLSYCYQLRDKLILACALEPIVLLSHLGISLYSVNALFIYLLKKITLNRFQFYSTLL